MLIHAQDGEKERMVWDPLYGAVHTATWHLSNGGLLGYNKEWTTLAG